MTDRDFESEARAVKVETITRHLLSVHGSLKAEGALGEFSTPWGWARHPRFPFSALVAASGAKPASEKTKAMVLERLRGEPCNEERASYVRSGMAHSAAGPSELEGATTNLHVKANQLAKVYGLIVSSGSTGKTGAEISELLNIPRHVLSARLRELENDGLIVKSGKRRKTKDQRIANSIYLKAVA